MMFVVDLILDFKAYSVHWQPQKNDCHCHTPHFCAKQKKDEGSVDLLHSVLSCLCLRFYCNRVSLD